MSWSHDLRVNNDGTGYVTDVTISVSALDEDMFHWCGGSRDYVGERIEFYQRALQG